MAIEGENEIMGLDVTVDDPLGVRILQRLGHFHNEPRRRAKVLLSEGCASTTGARSFASLPGLPDSLVQGAPLDQSHGVVVGALLFALGVDGNDVGMVETRGCLGLPTKALYVALLGSSARGEDLQGDQTVEGSLDGLIDHPHPPTPDLPDDLKTTQTPALVAHWNHSPAHGHIARPSTKPLKPHL